MPPPAIQAMLPERLTVETFDGDAWLAVVPFSMEKIRPWWACPVPGISWFLETNVRTYVRHDNGETGVWFFSLDANQALAVWIATRFWNLNYRQAQINLEHSSEQVHYTGSCQFVDAAYDFCITCDPEQPLQTARPQSLDFFLLERYRLFARHPSGRFLTGEVHHPPYTFQGIQLLHCEQSLTASHGLPIPPGRAPDHAVYSPGVHVRVSPLQWLDE